MEKVGLVRAVAFRKSKNPFASDILSGIQIYNIKEKSRPCPGWGVDEAYSWGTSLPNSLQVTLEIRFFKDDRNRSTEF